MTKQLSRDQKLMIFLVVAGALYFLTRSPATHSFVSSQNIELEYYFEYPAGGNDSSVLPLLVNLHCNGCTPQKSYGWTMQNLTQAVRGGWEEVLLMKQREAI